VDERVTSANTGEESGEEETVKDELARMQRQLVGMEPGGPQVLYTLIPATVFSVEDWSTWGLDGPWTMHVHGIASQFVELSMEGDQLVLRCGSTEGDFKWTFRGSVEAESGQLVLVDEVYPAPGVAILNLSPLDSGGLGGFWLDLDEEEDEESYVAVVMQPGG
jgi:hypothetical protein